MKDLTRDPLADRLAALDIPVPITLIPRVRSGAAQKPASPPAGGRRVAFPAVVLVLLLLVTAGAYFFPAFGQGLAEAPVVGVAAGPFLRNAGLASVSGRITALDDTAISSGYRIRLLGGYADSARTVLLIHVDPPGGLAFHQPLLTDQFGRRYRHSAGYANSGTGEEALTFEALRWPASRVGVRLTLQISGLEVPKENRTVAGSWKLHGTLAVDEARSLPVPPGARLGNLGFTFVSVEATPGALQVKITVTGTANVDLASRIPDGLKGRLAFRMGLTGPDGAEVLAQQMQIGRAGDRTQVTALWLRTAPGRYRLTTSYEGLGEFERQIDVP